MGNILEVARRQLDKTKIKEVHNYLTQLLYIATGIFNVYVFIIAAVRDIKINAGFLSLTQVLREPVI